MKILTVALLFPVVAFSQSRESVFKVSFKGKEIGTLTFSEERTGNTIVRDLRTNTDAKIMVMSIHVESEINSTHKDGLLVRSTAYRHANRGSADVHSRVDRRPDGKFTCERNGQQRIESRKIDYMIIDLYVREPIGITELFSTMYAKFISVKAIGTGKYLVEAPDNKNSWYTYKDGKLIGIESETPLGIVTSTLK